MKRLSILVGLGLLVGCSTSSPKPEEPSDVSMRHTLTDDDRRIPAPDMRHPHRRAPVEGVEEPDIEVADLSEGRTHIAQGGVQVSLLALTKDSIQLGFKKGEEEFEVTHQGAYAEGAAFGLVYSADVSDTVYLRLEARENAGPIDLTAAGEIAAREIRERVDCDGVTGMQSVAQDNGTVLVRGTRDEKAVCTVRVGLYTRSVVADTVITEIPKDLRPPAEIY